VLKALFQGALDLEQAEEAVERALSNCGAHGGGKSEATATQRQDVRGCSALEPLCLKIALLAMATFVDIAAAAILLLHGDIILACVLGTTALTSAMHLGCRARAEVETSRRTGVPTDELLVIFDRVRGLEASVSLTVASYALPAAITQPWQLVIGVLVLICGLSGLAAHMFEQLDLAPPRYFEVPERLSRVSTEKQQRDQPSMT
jgi:hypothetical protein